LAAGESEIELLTASYSYHAKPLHIAERDGHRTHYLLRLQTEGRCRARVGDTVYAIEPGDLILVPPSAAYELHVDEAEQQDGKRRVSSGDYYIFCRGTWVDRWWSERPRPAKLRIPLDDGIVTLWRQLVAEHRRLPPAPPGVTDCLLRAVLLSVDRLCSERRPEGAAAFLAYRMKSFIEERATERFKLEELAARCGVSVSRAVHLYKQFFGKSIIQYALEVRLKTAAERILYTQAPLESIAESSGFPSYTYFFRVFKRTYGLSPQEFRRRHGLPHRRDGAEKPAD